MGKIKEERRPSRDLQNARTGDDGRPVRGEEPAGDGAFVARKHVHAVARRREPHPEGAVLGAGDEDVTWGVNVECVMGGRVA